MIIKIKTFSGETFYIPEEDYLEEIMYSKPDAAVVKKLIDKAPQKYIDSYKGRNISVFDQERLPLGYRIKSILQSKARNYDWKLKSGKLPQLTESSLKRHPVRF